MTVIPPCTCGHDFSMTSMFHLGGCPRAALPAVEEPTVVVISRADPYSWGPVRHSPWKEYNRG